MLTIKKIIKYRQNKFYSEVLLILNEINLQNQQRTPKIKL